MQKHVELEINGLTLRGMIHIPDGDKKKYPFVAMYHGFTGTKVEAGFKFVQLSRMLEKAGIGSVRFDFSGSGESDGTFDSMSLNTEIEEAALIFEYMSGLEYADKNNLFILGFSMGGLVSSLVAPRLKKLKGMVLWAPAGSMYDYVEQITQDSIKEGKSNPESGGLCINPILLDELKRLDVYNIIRGFKGDVLLIHGSNDNSVSFDESVKYTGIYGEKSRLMRIENADHLFSSTEWSNLLLNGTVDFIIERMIQI